MAEMTDNKVIEIIGNFIGEHEIKLIDFTSVTSVDEFSSVLLVQPTGAGNRIEYGVFKNQVIAEIKEPADKVINEVKDAGKDAALVIEAATKAVGEANTAASSADEAARVARQAAENVKDGDDGKTPVFGNVTAKGGDKAAATYTLNGVDANGNPVIDVDFTLEKGADGKHPVLQSGTITTLAPSEKVQASFRANGYDVDGRPIYLVDLAIPKGDKGQAGDGSGNVLVNTSSLKKDARYLFTPKADGSAEGSFVEAKTSLITNDSKFQTASDVKSAIDAVEYGGRNYVKSSNVFNVSAYLGAKYTKIVNVTVDEWGINDATRFQVSEGTAALKCLTNEVLPKLLMNENIALSIWVKNLSAKDMQVSFTGGLEKQTVKAGESKRVKIKVQLKTGYPQFQFHSMSVEESLDFVVMRRKVELNNISDWTPAPEDFTSFAEGANSITTLTSIPTDKRTLIATLSAATNITLKEPLEVGKELLISINPTADFEQPLPVSGGWQSLDGDTLSLKANKPAELSILCVEDSKYVLSSKVAE